MGLLVGFWVDLGLWDIKTHPNHGGRRRPTAAMVPPPRRRRTQQSANMLRDKSMSLKLENIIVYIIN